MLVEIFSCRRDQLEFSVIVTNYSVTIDYGDKYLVDFNDLTK